MCNSHHQRYPLDREVEYKYSDYFIVGGGTGIYSITSPFPDRPSEYAIMGLTQSASGQSATAMVSTTQLSGVLAQDGSVSVGNNANAPVNGIIFVIPSGQSALPTYQWEPMANGIGKVFVAINVPAANSVFVTIVFRWKDILAIPGEPMVVHDPEHEDLINQYREMKILEATAHLREPR